MRKRRKKTIVSGLFLLGLLGLLGCGSPSSDSASIAQLKAAVGEADYGRLSARAAKEAGLSARKVRRSVMRW